MSEFVKVTKDGQTIEVHPDALKNHLELGWKEVEMKSEKVAAASAEKPAVESKTKSKPEPKPKAPAAKKSK